MHRYITKYFWNTKFIHAFKTVVGSKVHIFWEGHKILRSRFDRVFFAEICGHIRIYETEQRIIFHSKLFTQQT